MSFKKLLLPIIICLAYRVSAQIDATVIQVSGVIAEADTSLPVGGASLFVPGTSRGTISSSNGFFTLPLVKGDTLFVRSFGYKNQKVIISPDSVDTSEIYTLFIEMEADTTQLPTFVFRPFPTDMQFRNMVVYHKLPENKNVDAMYNNLNDQVMTSLMSDLRIDGGEAHKFLMRQQLYAIENRFAALTYTFLDPFAWARMIKDLKALKEKKRKEKLEKQKKAY